MLLIELLDFPDDIVIELLAALVLRNINCTINCTIPAKTQPDRSSMKYDCRIVSSNLLMLDQHNQSISYHEGYAYRTNTYLRGAKFSSPYCICTTCGSVNESRSPTFNTYTSTCPACTLDEQSGYNYIDHKLMYWPSDFETLSLTTQRKVHKLLVKKLLDKTTQV